MAAYIVTYDLNKPGQNYKCVAEKLEAYPAHWKVQQSVWLLRTNQSAKQVRDIVGECLDPNDKLIVAKLSGEAAWKGYGDKISEWLKETLLV